MPEPRVQYTKTSDGVRIAYCAMGSGPTLLITPYQTFSHIGLEWQSEEQRALLNRLASRCRIVRYDRRGTGLSERRIELSPQTEAADLDAVAAAIGNEPFVLVGRGFSGPAAIRHTANNPDRVTHLVLYDTAISLQEMLDDPVMEPWIAMAKTLPRQDYQTAVNALSRMLPDPEGFASMLLASMEPEYFVLSVTAENDATQSLDEVRCPSLVIAERWPGLPADRVLRLASRLPGAELVIIDRYPGDPWADTADVTDEIYAFLGFDLAPTADSHPERTRETAPPAAITFASSRYVATRLLGEGSQKRVYLARDTQLHRNVAISIIKAEGLDPGALDRVRREAQTIAALGTQPNLIAIFDIGEEAGRPYTVSEYAPGGDLRHKLREADGRLPIDRAVAIAQDLCRALALAHEHGVLHRDVKPDNVWFTADGTAKLGDFGLAVAFGHSRVTAPGTLLGTAAYMAPEQALGSEVDARADLYSLGCVLYEMVTGQAPFPGDSAVAVISQHVNSPPPKPSDVREGIPPALEALIVQLLAKAPENRPASATAVLDALAVVSGSAEVAVAPARPPARARTRTRARRWKPGRRFVAGTAGVVALSAMAAGIVAFAIGRSGGGSGEESRLLVAEGYTPALELRECPPDLKRDPDVICSDLVVPENRSKPDGRQVRLLVTYAKSTAAQPGIPFFATSGYYSIAGEQDLRAYADVVGMSRRGEEYSEPVLTCPEVASAQRQILGIRVEDPKASDLFLNASEQCGQRLVSEGYDLSAYGDSEMVDDIRDLAITMGWKQINVEAFHQGARVAMLLAVRYPSLVHAMVLREPYHSGVNPSNDIIATNSAVHAYIEACRADAACAAAYPDLEQGLSSRYQRWQEEPLVTTAADPAGGPDIPVLLDGDAAAMTLRLVLGVPPALPFIARGIPMKGNDGDWGPAIETLVENMGVDPTTSWGASFSQQCEDDDPAWSRAVLDAAAAAYPMFRAMADDPALKLCARWPTEPRTGTTPGYETTIKAPTLILTGTLNPVSQPADVQGVAEAFRDATVAVFPSMTDNVVDSGPSCIRALRLAFLRDPAAKLDIDGCIAKVPPIQFVGT